MKKILQLITILALATPTGTAWATEDLSIYHCSGTMRYQAPFLDRSSGYNRWKREVSQPVRNVSVAVNGFSLKPCLDSPELVLLTRKWQGVRKKHTSGYELFEHTIMPPKVISVEKQRSFKIVLKDSFEDTYQIDFSAFIDRLNTQAQNSLKKISSNYTKSSETEQLDSLAQAIHEHLAALRASETRIDELKTNIQQLKAKEEQIDALLQSAKAL